MWLWNARLWAEPPLPPRDRGALLIEGATIRTVGEAQGSPPEGAIDLGGQTVLPGLIDAHCHFSSDLSRSPGFGPPPATAGEPPRSRALGYFILAAAAASILRSGFTTIRDVGSYDDEALAAGEAIKLGVIPGPRVWSCGRIISATAPGGRIFGTMYREADGPWEMRQAVREQIQRGAHFIKFMATGARSVVGEDPEPPQMTGQEMAAICDEAHRMGLRVAAHAEGLEGARLAITSGADTIEHGLALHRDPSLLELMASKGVVLVPTLSTFHDLAVRFASDFHPQLVEQAKRQSEEAGHTVAAAQSMGVTIAAGYDSGPPGSAAMELVRLVEAGLAAPEAVAAATAGGAQALGRSDLGLIKPGAVADLIVVDGRPDMDITVLTDSSRITGVYQNGRLLQ